jgi:signal transduction histidine kinase
MNTDAKEQSPDDGAGGRAPLEVDEAERQRRAYVHLTEAQRLSQTGSFTWDFDRGELLWSEELLRIFEFEPTTTVTTDLVRNFVHPDDLPAWLATVEGAGAGVDIDLPYRIITASGVLKHLRAVGHRIDHAADRPVFVGAVQDLTQAKLAEADLRRSEAFLAEGQRLSSTGSFLWFFDTNEITFSDELYRIYEIDPAAALTTALQMSRAHPGDRALMYALGSRLGRDGGEITYEHRLQMPDGRIKHLRTYGRQIVDKDGRNACLGVSQDLTKQKLAEEALNTARAELAHVARAATLSALTASIAHEVNQPLTSLVTNASTCVRMLAADPPNLELAQTTAQRTIRDANRASEVISRLRAMFARKQPAMEPVDLNQAAGEVLALSAGELQGAGVVVRTDFAEALPAVLGDRIQLQQVILNLVLNAIDAMREADGPRGLRVATAFDRPGQVRLTVRDEGTGIGPEALEKLFDAFYTTKSHGMGIGLSISQSIIQAHDGRLWAVSNGDEPGATFSFLIPCDDVGSSDLFSKDV